MFKNRIRLPIMFSKPQFPTERNIFRLADGSSKVQSTIIKNTYEGKTDYLPEDWHKKIIVALSHDEVTVEGERLLSNVVMAGDYSISWDDFLNNPVSQSSFTVEVTPFDMTNSNCQTCEEMSQLSLVDDFTEEVWEEGTTHEFPDVLTDNDSICCNPFEISLVSYNTEYFEDVTLSASGVLTVTVKNPVPYLDQILIATYRVTCSDGSYDEANVYGNTSGSGTGCPPCALAPEVTYVSSSEVSIFWEILIGQVPANPWQWELFLSSDLGTPIDSGTCPAATGLIELSGLTSGISYTISIVSDCGGGNFSTPTLVVFEIPAFAPGTCGSFTITYLPIEFEAIQTASYMDCSGEIINLTFTYAQELTRCMLMADDLPIYFTASTVDISLNYIELC